MPQAVDPYILRLVVCARGNISASGFSEKRQHFKQKMLPFLQIYSILYIHTVQVYNNCSISQCRQSKTWYFPLQRRWKLVHSYCLLCKILIIFLSWDVLLQRHCTVRTYLKRKEIQRESDQATAFREMQRAKGRKIKKIESRIEMKNEKREPELIR